jgi:hypothetical protein
MFLNSSSSIVSYGQKLPAANSVADGTLFFKTAADPNGDNPLGLYVFYFQQDANPNIIGDQVGTGWQVASSSLNNGGVIGGELKIGTDGDGSVTVVPSLNSNPGKITFNNGAGLEIGSLGWSDANSSLFVSGNWIFQNPPSLNGGTFWTSLNDGAGSTLDADYLDGQHGAYYLDLANATGLLNLSQVVGPLAGVNGGTGLSSTVPGGIIFGTPGNTMAFTVAGTAGQILQSNGASSPQWVNTSSISIGTATQAINLSGGVAGDLLFQSAPNTTSFISGGTSGYVLTSTGASTAPTWQASSGGSVVIDDVGATPNASYYLTFVDNTSTNPIAALSVSSPQLLFNPFEGTLSAPNFNSLSDRRAKTNIRELGYGLKDVLKMKGQKFEMISNNKTSIGFIAQDLKEIIPEVVDQNSEDFLGVNYQILASVLVEAIKEQQAQINELKALVAKLID